MIKKCIIKPNISFFFMITFLILTFNSPAKASNVTANSCSASDIQTAINTVANGGGGTVTLPACDYKSGSPNGALWGNADRICIASEDELIFLGQGEATTRIGYADGTGAGSTNFSCPTFGAVNQSGAPIFIRGVGVKEIGQFTFDSNGGSGGISWQQCVGSTNEERRACTTAADGQRFHHVTILGLAYNARGLYYCQNWRGSTLIDHITISNTADVGSIYGISIQGGWDESAFVTNPVWGTDNGVFIEDSSFDGLYHPIEGFYASRLTARHNRFHNDVGATTGLSGISNGHGPGYTSGCNYGDPTNRVGAYRTEIYDNKWDAGAGLYMRGGFFIVTDNDFGSAEISSIPEPAIYSGRDNCNPTDGCPMSTTGYLTTEDCYQGLYAWYWDNTNQTPNLQTSYTCDLVGTDQDTDRYFPRAPQTGDPYYSGGTYTKYTYPHPLATGNFPPGPPKGKGNFPLDPPENLRTVN